MRKGLLLWGILLLGFLIKVPVLHRPLLGYFASYQTFNAMMAERMTRGTLQAFLIPETFLIWEGKPGLHLPYYPFGAFSAAVLKMLAGGSIDFWGRLQAAIFVLAAGLLFFRAVRKSFSEDTALWAAFVFTFSPMVLLSGISFQNEAAALFFLMASWNLLLSEKRGFMTTAGIFFSLAVIARIHFIFLMPAFLYWARDRERSIAGRAKFSLGTLLPAGLWFGFTYWIEKTNPNVLTSLFSQTGEGRIFHPLFFDPKYCGHVFDVLSGPWLTLLFLPFVILGFNFGDRKMRPFMLWLAGTLVLIFILPKKIWDHPFYLVQGVPAAAVLAAVPLTELMRNRRRPVQSLFCLVAIAFAMRYYVPPAWFISEKDSKIPEIGRRVEALTSRDDRIIAQHGTGSDLLYYTHRMGWPFDLKIDERQFENQARIRRLAQMSEKDPIRWLENLRREGASYLVISEPEEFQSRPAFYHYVTKHYAAVPNDSSRFFIYDLRDKFS